MDRGSSRRTRRRLGASFVGYFGQFDKGPNTEYDTVWAKDALDADHTEFGVESVRTVVRRTSAAVERVEASCDESVILFVSHGDALQILQTAFANVDPRTHRSLPHLETCELRSLTTAIDLD